MKKALQQEGSRDVSALLFVALARACGLGARLVVSLQTIPWRAEKVVVKKSKVGAGNGGRSMASRQGMGPDGASEEDEMEEVPIPGVEDKAQRTRKNNTRGAGNPKMKDPADLYRLRKQKPPPQTLAAKPKRKKKEGGYALVTPVDVTRHDNSASCVLGRGVQPLRSEMDSCRSSYWRHPQEGSLRTVQRQWTRANGVCGGVRGR